MHSFLTFSALALPLSASAGLDGVSPSVTHTPERSTAAGAAPVSLVFGDIDSDGAVDVLALSTDGAARLLRNLRDGTFEDVTKLAGLDGLDDVMSAAFGDFDADGKQDLYVGARSGAQLHRNLGQGQFEASALDVQHAGADLEAQWLDFDADGLVDLRLRTTLGELLFHNHGATIFERVDLPRFDLTAPVSGVARTAAAVDAAVDENGALDHAPSSSSGQAHGGGGSSLLPPNSIAERVGGSSAAFAACNGAPNVADQASANCISASSAPTLGMLYPLSTNLNVSSSGNVGVGTTSPSTKFQVVGQAAAGDLPAFPNHMSSSRVAAANAAIDIAIFGANEATSGVEVGIYGRTHSPAGYGVFSDGNLGVTGNATASGAVTGNTLVSSVATGTAPLSVASTTKVVSLNADQLDGFDSTAFSQLGNSIESAEITNGTIAAADLAADSVTGANIVNGSLTGADLSILSGDVGFGTLTPTARFDVLSPSSGGRFRVFDLVVNPIARTQLVAGMSGTSNAGAQLRFDGLAGGVYTDIGQSGSGSFVVETNDTPRVVVQQDGKVGIGTTTPQYAFDVGGRIQAESNWGGSGTGAVLTRDATQTRQGWMGPVNINGDYAVGVHDNTGLALDGAILHNKATDVTTVFADVKSFRVANPDDANTDLVYACVEGPEAAMYLRGTARLAGGQTTVELPRHFAVLAAAQGITVQLTPNSPSSRGLCVVNKSPTSFEVVELFEGRGNYEFDWEVKAVRKGFEGWNPVQSKVTPLAAGIDATSRAVPGAHTSAAGTRDE